MTDNKKPEIYPAMQYRYFRTFAVNFVRICVNLFLRLQYEGLENVPASGPAILVSNHTSMGDMLVIHSVFKPWICWVAKKELFSKPMTRQIYKRLGCIPVDRDKTDLMAARGIFTALRDKQIIGMFPQGTRVKREQIPYVRPRSGAIHFAIKTGVPILPVAVDGRFKLFGKVRIVYGKPIMLELDARAQYSAEELHRLTVGVMRQVYALIGYDYHLAAEAGGGGALKILLAKTSGFCFGVKNAVDAAWRMIDDGSPESGAPLYMLGELIHNRQVINELTGRGLQLAGRVDDVPDGAGVLIRAHGVPPATICDLEARGCKITDCTCPFVTKIHRIVRKAWQQGQRIIIAGSPGHPEVIGINGECGDTAVVIDSAGLAESSVFDDSEWTLVSQTTFSYAEYENICHVLKKKIAKLQIFDTICITTENRQKEAREIASQANIMFVIGSPGSSNTQKLLDICRSQCVETFLIEHPDQVRAILDEKSSEGLIVGVTAGASTPERIIREVIQTMTENEGFQNQQEQVDVSFSDFIDNIPHLKRGATVRGSIIRYDNETVYVDVHDKSEGRIPRHEFEGDPDFDLDQAIENHTEIDVYVRNIRNSDLGKEIVLSKARVDFGKYKGLIEDAYANKTPIAVKVVNVVKDGVIATYGGVDIYIHRTQLEMGMVNDLEPYKGKSLDILVTQYDPDKKRLRVSGSRRALLANERKGKADELWGTIEIGKEYDGTVRSLTDFGAFVDIGGVDGLVHVSELSWNRIRHPSEVVSVGDQIHVFVKDFDPEKKRISLGYKRSTDDPYHDVETRFPVGSIVHGTVVRMFPFGAFVEIAPGVDALCHISQIANVRLTKPNDVLTEGMEIDARVLEVSNESRRVSISIKEVEPINPPGYEETHTTYEEPHKTYVDPQKTEE